MIRAESRSPRRGETDSDKWACASPEVEDWQIAGLSPKELEDFKAGAHTTKHWLEGFLKSNPGDPTRDGPREFAAGLPLQAAQVLLFAGSEGLGVAPWNDLPAAIACVAAAVRTFGRLIPGFGEEGTCETFCKQALTSYSS